MQQPRTDTVSALIRVAGLVSAGLAEQGPALALQAVTHAGFSEHLADFVAAEDAHTQIKEPLAASRTAYKAAQRDIRNFIRTSRDAMKPVFGYSYNEAWGTLGFFNSLIVPASATRFVPMMQKLRNYLQTNPVRESASMGVTVAQATAILSAFNAAEEAFLNLKLAHKTARDLKTKKATTLRQKIRVVIAELKSKLPSVDPRWERFGLNQPGIKHRPAQPVAPVVSPLGDKGIVMTWEPVPSAEYYRIFLQRIGVDEEPKHIGNTADPLFVLESLPSGSMGLSLSAANQSGEGVRSPAVVFAVP